jgi:hypothetical protein
MISPHLSSINWFLFKYVIANVWSKIMIRICACTRSLHLKKLCIKKKMVFNYVVLVLGGFDVWLSFLCSHSLDLDQCLFYRTHWSCETVWVYVYASCCHPTFSWHISKTTSQPACQRFGCCPFRSLINYYIYIYMFTNNSSIACCK